MSLLVKIEGDPLNTQHAQHRSVQATEEEAVFIRGVNTNEDSPNAQHRPREEEESGRRSGRVCLFIEVTSRSVQRHRDYSYCYAKEGECLSLRGGGGGGGGGLYS